MRAFVVFVALLCLTLTYVFWNGQCRTRVAKDSEGLKPRRGKNSAA
jgi:hypothetical protein